MKIREVAKKYTRGKTKLYGRDIQWNYKLSFLGTVPVDQSILWGIVLFLMKTEIY